MLITYTQLFIFICIIFFILFNIISVYFFQETYNNSIIKVTDISNTWKTISFVSNYSNWWKKFAGIKNVEPFINILDIQDNNYIKILYKNNNINEVWTFIIKNENSTLYIKKQTLINSKWQDFLNKYLRNKKDIKKFIKDFKKTETTYYKPDLAERL